jgi:hypothetical protein
MAMPPDNRPSFARVMDIQMMLLFGGGRIRTEAELRGLFAAAGLEVTRVLPRHPHPISSLRAGLRPRPGRVGYGK